MKRVVMVLMLVVLFTAPTWASSITTIASCSDALSCANLAFAGAGGGSATSPDATLSNSYSGPGSSPSGVLSSWAFSDGQNLEAFVYQFTVDYSHATYITFNGYPTAPLGVYAPTGATSPSFFQYNYDPVAGSTLNVWFEPAIYPADNTLGKPKSPSGYFVVLTNAVKPSPNATTLHDGMGSNVVNSLQPAPEPASIALFGSGLLGLAGFARRRFKK